MVDETVINITRRYLQALQIAGIPVSYGVIFGSQARGDAGKWSDIDLVVVSPHFDLPRQREEIHLLWKLAARTDSRIEPVAVGEQQYRLDDSSAIIEMARREGEAVYPTPLESK